MNNRNEETKNTDFVCTLDLNQLTPLTEEEKQELDVLNNMSDEEVITAALADPDCQPLVK